MKQLKEREDLTLTVESHQPGVRFVDKIEDYYDIDRNPMEEGQFSTIKRAVKRVTGFEYCVKIIPKQNIAKGRFEESLAVMKDMDHPNIIKLFGVFEDFLNYHLVMEICEGGTLMDAILDSDTQ